MFSLCTFLLASHLDGEKLGCGIQEASSDRENCVLSAGLAESIKMGEMGQTSSSHVGKEAVSRLHVRGGGWLVCHTHLGRKGRASLALPRAYLLPSARLRG